MQEQERDLKAAYVEELRNFYLSRVRVASVWAALFFPLFSVLDWIVYPQYLILFLTIRGVAEALFLGAWAFVFTPGGKRHPQIIAVTQYFVFAGSITLMVHLAEGYGSPYYVGIILVLSFLIFIYPLSFRAALLVNAVIFLSYLVPILAVGEITNLAVFLTHTIFLFNVMFFIVVGSAYAERMRYNEFFSRYNLARANDELTQLDVMKSEFFANVSHEVRTPLTSVLGPLQSLFQGDVGSLSPLHATLVEQAYRNGLKLLDMINHMLDFAKFDARKMELRLQCVDVAGLSKELVTVFEDVAVRKGLSLGCQIISDSGDVYLDVEKTERILTNLVRNALKFTDQGGVTVTVDRQDSFVVIIVEDTGIGIPEDQLASIFERFRQVDSSATRRYEGTGLGLAIVSEAVGIMQGVINVSSELGRGTRFTVRLPVDLETRVFDASVERRGPDRRSEEDSRFQGQDRRQAPRRSTDAIKVDMVDIAFVERRPAAGLVQGQDYHSQDPEQESTDIHVLYVEDNDDLRSYITAMLRRFGHSVTGAPDGLAGWERALDEQPDVVVSDIMMPRMSGYELLAQLKSDEKTRHIPVILISAKSEVDSRIEGLETGADDYLAKPINLRELDARIRNLHTTRQFQAALTQSRELEERVRELSLSFSRALELKDRYTAGHSNDVLAFGTLIADELGVEPTQVLKESLLLHDIGKIGVPDRVLLKEEPLSGEEWEIMKSHAETGARFLASFDSFREVSEIVLAHQEHFDGSGYPRGLSGDEGIPLPARIIAVADAWHAMTEDRPYRRALPYKKALSEIIRNRGIQFDPEVADALIRGLVAQGVVSEDDVKTIQDNTK